MSQQPFSSHRKVKANDKRPNRRKTGISHVVFASVLLRENPFEEVDYDNYYYYYRIMNKSQETTVFHGRRKLTSAMKQGQKSDGRLQI